MKITEDQIQKIIGYLKGSCETMQNGIIVVTENDDLTDDDLTDEQLSHIDQEIFLCSDCGWWCPIEEETKSVDGGGELGCAECNQEEEEEEEDEDEDNE